ncbi:PREDICTED: long chain acyl-CoA synthetase 1 isoform X2 [Brassica oleracea var. oleracea]|uniref:long chain acyl-CoA synthetase 1 isoform X2 n=1 Tax=Brassica oleracea var. oleracea TaxID=109376 RepID=UPI0006A70BE4|nr:PREDICTED: long chain acyl-CoA synthetase 1 isoform X2 [Brassica oleracea var. oleracea]
MKFFAAKLEEGVKGGNGKPSVGPVYRNLLSEKGFPPMDSDITTAWDVFRSLLGFVSKSVEKFPYNKMLGWRRIVDEKVGPYMWKTYKEAYGEVLQIGSAIRALGAEPGCRVGIYGVNCPQWIIAMEACAAHTLICVPLYDTLGSGAVDYIVDHAEIDFVFVQDNKIKGLLEPNCKCAKRLKAIVSFVNVSEEDSLKASEIGVKTFSWLDFLRMGREKPEETNPPKPSNICTIMYTSGTSGNPKGVVLTHEAVATYIVGMDLYMDQFEDKMTHEDVYLSFLPLAHILDRMNEEYFFRKGASVGYYHGDLNVLRDDIQELKPTYLAGVPRVFERIHEGIQKALQELNPRRRFIFNALYQHKLSWLNRGYSHSKASPMADFIAFRKIRDKLGGRIRLLVSGGAPLSCEIEEFLRVTCCCFVVQGYGLTETLGGTALGFPDEMCMLGTVGIPAVYNEIRLEEVAEMGYDPLGEIQAGEICIRGTCLFSGYYKNPELTQEVMKNGWFHTGDIGEIHPNRVLKIIDRKKNLIKLSQGEYVALENLENIYGQNSVVQDIWVYGDSFKSMLVAVIVPNPETVNRWAKDLGFTKPFEELCSLSELHDEHIILELKSTAEKNKLRKFEYIKAVTVETKPFDVERDLVTATLKNRRNNLLKFYQVQVDEMYRKLSLKKM